MYVRLMLLVCTLLLMPFAYYGCAGREVAAALAPIEMEMEILVLDANTGFPLRGVVIIAGDRLFVADGPLRLHGVPGPLVIHAWKPGWAPSYPRTYAPGPVSITLSRTTYADNE